MPRSGFENQGRFYHSDCILVAEANVFHPLFLRMQDCGVDDSIQFLDSRRSVRTSEGGLRQACAVDGPIRMQNLRAELVDDLLVNGHAGAHELLGEVIGFEKMRAETNEDLSNGGFSGSDAAGKADFQQASPEGWEASVICGGIFIIFPSDFSSYRVPSPVLSCP